MELSKTERLRAELAQAEQAERAERERIRKSVKPVYRFHIVPSEDNWHRVYSDTHKMYRIYCEIINGEELRAVGAEPEFMGGMDYIVDMAAGMLVCATGGGRLWKMDSATAASIGSSVKENPGGGDITHLMLKQGT